MWIAAEAIKDGFVPQLEVIVLWTVQRAEESNGVRVYHSGFAVHVRHVQEYSLIYGKRRVMGTGNCFLGECQGHRVTGECCRPATIDVPRKLVENHDLGEPALRLNAPTVQLASSGGGM